MGGLPVLARRNDSGLAIEYAAHPLWLQSRLTAPSRGMQFNEWFRGSEQPDGKLTKETHKGTLEASPFRLSGSSTLFELRLLI